MTLKTKLEVISKEDFTRIHDASIKILQETGIVFHHKEVLEIFKKHGAKTNDKTVYLSRRMVENALKTCPSTFKWKARNNNRSVIVGEGFLTQPNAGPVYIQDLDAGRRLAVLQDYSNIQKLCQASDVIDLVGSIPINPSDVNTNEKHLYMLYETIKNTDKPLIGHTVYSKQAQEMLDMTEIAMGKNDFLKENYCIGVIVNSLSPLAYSDDAIETIIQYAKRNQIIIIAPAAMAGVSGPINLFGTAVLTNVEILAGIVLTQLINPGNPVVYSTASNVANMKRASFCGGSPETMLMNIANLQMGLEFYQLPVRTMCGITDAKTINCQAGYETLQSLIMAMLGGAHMVVQCLGVLDTLMTTSYEKFIIDEELIRRVICISKGIDTSEQALSLELIQEVGHNGSYLTHKDTFDHFRDRWLPTMSDWESYEGWKKNGSEDIEIIANRKYREILKNAPETLIDDELDKDLKTYINKTFKK
ncbi:MAG: trimethylamine--corrinoid methyltransferase [Desulfitibacter sp. BRH_c19]|nr:MAG: trimethylamine--corrinoid methyltransferase [Desulfitibacter sp. BRH_c19]